MTLGHDSRVGRRQVTTLQLALRSVVSCLLKGDPLLLLHHRRRHKLGSASHAACARTALRVGSCSARMRLWGLWVPSRTRTVHDAVRCRRESGQTSTVNPPRAPGPNAGTRTASCHAERQFYKHYTTVKINPIKYDTPEIVESDTRYSATPTARPARVRVYAWALWLGPGHDTRRRRTRNSARGSCVSI